jgi:YVTN family beta-propeller protein
VCAVLADVTIAQDNPLPLLELPNSQQYPVYTANTLYVRRNGNLIVSNPMFHTITELIPSDGKIVDEVDVVGSDNTIVTLPSEVPLKIIGNQFWVVADEQIADRQNALTSLTRILWGDFTFSIPTQLQLGYVPNASFAVSLGQHPQTDATSQTRAIAIHPRTGILYSVAVWNTESSTLDNRYTNLLDELALETGLLATVQPNLLDVIDQRAHLPSALEIDTVRNRLYVAYSASNRVSVIDLKTLTLISTFATGANPIDIALSRDGAWVYVHNSVDNTITVRDTQFYGLANTLPTSLRSQEADVWLGAQLFHSASDPRMSWNESASCNTCHASPLDTVTSRWVQPINVDMAQDMAWLNAHIAMQQGGSGLSVLEMQALVAFLQGS